MDNAFGPKLASENYPIRARELLERWRNVDFFTHYASAVLEKSKFAAIGFAYTAATNLMC